MALPPLFSIYRNALHIAVSCGKADVVEWLFEEYNVELNVKDYESGWTALHRSLYYGHVDCAIALAKVRLMVLNIRAEKLLHISFPGLGKYLTH